METHEQAEKQNPKESSTCSSPSHDFSFTISLSSSSKLNDSRCPTKTDPLAVDLSPADDIFFHGHLLPLHLLARLPASPRTSTGSYNDGFALPATTNEAEGSEGENRVRARPVKSFSLFSLPRWRKGVEGNEQQHKKKLSHAVKKYIRMLFQRSRTQTPSSSLNTKTVVRGRRGELFSAPASMRTSPTNSGHLRVSTAGLSSSSASTSSSSSDSTMEELQAAIQAAIAHCKNSSSAVDRGDKAKDS